MTATQCASPLPPPIPSQSSQQHFTAISHQPSTLFNPPGLNSATPSKVERPGASVGPSCTSHGAPQCLNHSIVEEKLQGTVVLLSTSTLRSTTYFSSLDPRTPTCVANGEHYCICAVLVQLARICALLLCQERRAVFYRRKNRRAPPPSILRALEPSCAKGEPINGK